MTRFRAFLGLAFMGAIRIAHAMYNMTVRLLEANYYLYNSFVILVRRDVRLVPFILK